MSADQPSINLLDLVNDPSRATQMDRDCIPALLTQLSAVQACMAARLVATSQETTNRASSDALLNVNDAAARLGPSPDWLYRRTKMLPFVVRVGGRVRFSANGIDRFIRNKTGR